MKKFAKRLTALALALLLAAGALGQTAFASWALGTELVGRTTELAAGVSWTSQSLWSASKSDLRTENYITYSPGAGVAPMVFSGAYVASRNTAAAAAAALEAQGYRVIAGVNGGFFNSDGTVVGLLMTEGVVRSLDLYNGTLLGFTRDGQVFIDESGRTMTKSVSWEAQGVSRQYKLAGFNAYRSSDDLGGLYLYNRDFASKVSYDAGRGCVAVVLTPVSGGGETEDGTQPPEDGGETVDGTQPPEDGGETVDGTQPPEDGGETVDGTQPPKDGGETVDGTRPPEDGEDPGEDGEDPGKDDRPSEADSGLIMNGTLTLTVEEIVDTNAGDAFNGCLTDGRYMLYANYYNGNGALLDALRSLTPGQQVSVTVSGVSEQWADAAYGISGLYTLLRDGEIVSGLPTSANPCTAVGVREDGTAVFYTIDGRQSGYSVGATYAQVAQRLQELGCVTAVALDGGGSTTLGAVLPGQHRFTLLNHPSQTGRALNNFIFLVAGEEYAGTDPGFYLSSDTQVVFIGASLNVSAAGYDQWGGAAFGPEPDGGTETEPDGPGLAPDWSATGGTIEGDGLTAVYTAGDAAGTYTVSAGHGSDLPVRVVDTLSSLWVTRKGSSKAVASLVLMPGDTVELSAAGAWWNLPVAMDGSDVTWEADDVIGTVDALGSFTAAGWDEDVSGSITVSAGGRTASVQVTVRAYPFPDLMGHWSAYFATRLYLLGLTNGRVAADGAAVFEPNAEMTRGELFAFITRLLHVDTDEFQDVELPFEDADSIPDWLMPDVKAMYALGVLNGSGGDEGKLYANVSSRITREETMTLLGRILADREGWDLSDFADSDLVSDWARPYVEALVALNVVQGSGGMLMPKADITRGEAAKLLVEVNGLEKAELTPRPSGPEDDEPEDPGDTPDDPEQPGEDTGDPEAPEDPGDAPDDPERPGEGTGDPEAPGDPS